MTKLTLHKFERHEDMTTVRFDCDLFVTCAGDGLWGCEAGRRVRVFTIDVSTRSSGDDVCVQVSVGHDSDWDIYTDTAFERAISDALGFRVRFTEQGMQDNERASMEA